MICFFASINSIMLSVRLHNHIYENCAQKKNPNAVQNPLSEV